MTKSRYRASGHVEITYLDTVITCDEVEYDEETREGFASGDTRFSQGNQWLACSRAEFNFDTQTGVFYDASGYTDRQFLITGRTIHKTGPDTYRIDDGSVTSCQQQRPKWSFGASKTNITVDSTARFHHLLFRIKGVPVFYAPYLVVPMEQKKRSSGFVTFHTGTSTSKGRVLSEGYFQTLGRSADVTLYGDYFTLRGLAIGSVFRARPNPATRFYLQAYGIHDKLDQGGILLFVDGESQLGRDWRAVARVNVSSNFIFRQAFADSFRAATVSHENANAFLTRNHASFSTNVAYQRQEVLFPVHPLVIRKLPSLEFLSLGTRLGHSPIIAYLRSSVDGMSRLDNSTETPKLVQRLDLYPRFAVQLPAFKGFSVLPSAGLRATYYGARLSDQSPTGVTNQDLRRRYADLQIDLRMPVLQKDYTSSSLGSFKHTIEPFAIYRRINGVKDLNETIRFDEEDAIADTNEIEYGMANRFFRSRETAAGAQHFEFMSLKLVQKYYFDPTFGGAFRPGEPNSFYPLNTVSGFYQMGIERNLGPLSMILQLSPKDGVHHDIRADFDIDLGSWRDASVSTLWQEGMFFLAGTYFRTQYLEPGTFSSNQIQGQVGYGSPLRGLSASTTLSYNLLTTQLLNSQTRLNYMWDCCGIAAEFMQFDLGIRTESRFSFSFTLKGIGSFGNLKRPESLF